MATTLSLTPTAEQLASLSKACSHLWKLDENAFLPNKHYTLNVQESKKAYDRSDVADQPLFGNVNKSYFMALPTFKAFYNLLDNYEKSTGAAEVVTAEEITENWSFINAISETKCIKYLHNYLVAKGKAPKDDASFKKFLYKLWFGLYARTKTGILDSSGFEHVFIGEISNGKVIGFHNWIHYFIQEARGNVDYKGYIIPRNRKKYEALANSETRALTIQFSWGDEVKSVSSTLIGTSPEFEIALYTLCFLEGKEDNLVNLGQYEVNIKCHHWNTRDGDKIGSCYPVIDGEDSC